MSNIVESIKKKAINCNDVQTAAAAAASALKTSYSSVVEDASAVQGTPGTATLTIKKDATAPAISSVITTLKGLSEVSAL